MTVMRFGLIAGSAEDLPGLQPCHAAFDWCPGYGQRPVDGSLGEGELTTRWSFESGGDPGAGALVCAVGEDRDALTLAGLDDAMSAGRGQINGCGRAARARSTGSRPRGR